jgi:predicted nucleic acid-binding protein
LADVCVIAMPVVSNTGPLISAFQSDSVPLLVSLFDEIHVPSGVVAELYDHGWAEELKAVSLAVPIPLTAAEQQRVGGIAAEIARQSRDDASSAVHHGEAEAIVLAQRLEAGYDLVLLDELAARSVAHSMGLMITGFPGALLTAVEFGLITPDDLRQRLERCCDQGTHYGERLVQSIYDEARRRWNQ